MIRTKTREGAKVSSRNADAIEYRQNLNNPLVGDTNDIGGIGNEQIEKGIWYPNVQSALEDLSSLILGNIGDVDINTTGTSPQGVQQLGNVKFSGTVAFITEQTETTSKIVEIMGIPVTLESGETADQVAVKFVNAVKPYINDNKLFAQIEQMSSDPTTVEFRHIDYRDHTYTNQKMYGIEANFTLSSPARKGVGTWIKLGQEAKTFEGADDPVTLHYFKRLA
ncbi:hypothetical protein [Erwinia phage FBB1]|nr:hypothetical protein [Erwinia phage FBB1]